MKMNKWRKEHVRLAKREQAVHAARKELQANCPHETLHYKYDGSGGSWDNPRGDYWIDFRCQDCGKYWTTDQTREEVANYPQAKEVKSWK